MSLQLALDQIQRQTWWFENEPPEVKYQRHGKALDATQDLSGLVLCYSTSVGDVTRYGKDSAGRMWHGINWYDPNVSVSQGTKRYIAMR
jgi:hypothetical protein